MIFKRFVEQLKGFLANSTTRFTDWYIKKDFKIYFDTEKLIVHYICPRWLILFMWLFSVELYMKRKHVKVVCVKERKYEKKIEESIHEINSLLPKPCPECGKEAETWTVDFPEVGLSVDYCGCKECGYYRLGSDGGAIASWNQFTDEYSNIMQENIFNDMDFSRFTSHFSLKSCYFEYRYCL